MTRVLMLGTILLLSVTWLAAQQDQANPAARQVPARKPQCRDVSRVRAVTLLSRTRLARRINSAAILRS